jgi:hypothetical protein
MAAVQIIEVVQLQFWHFFEKDDPDVECARIQG